MSEAIEALNCPNCGAAVSSDSSHCVFCKTRLKTMACPGCMSLMFVGSSFCGRCGRRVDVIREDQNGQPGQCPRCRLELATIMIGNTAVHECSECGGYWVERSVFESLCSSKEEQATVLAFDRTRARAGAGAGEEKIRYVPCPRCGELMNRSNFARSSGVVIDICKQHGVWFDADELTKVVEFIQNGGMSIAREREKLDIEEQRSRLREEQFKIDRLDRPSASDWDDLSIGGFMKRLFE